jgi:hypothetical protein
MAFTLSPLLQSDSHEFVVLDDLAMRDTPSAQAMEREAQLKGTTRQAIIEGFSKYAEEWQRYRCSVKPMSQLQLLIVIPTSFIRPERG